MDGFDIARCLFFFQSPYVEAVQFCYGRFEIVHFGGYSPTKHFNNFTQRTLTNSNWLVVHTGGLWSWEPEATKEASARSAKSSSPLHLQEGKTHSTTRTQLPQ